jgi:hypothetical protein
VPILPEVQRVRGIVSTRLGSPYPSGRSARWLKIKNPDAPAVTREAKVLKAGQFSESTFSNKAIIAPEGRKGLANDRRAFICPKTAEVLS